MNSGGELTKRAALEDISKLAKIITESHPDPFLHASSQISFYEAVEAIASGLKGDTINAGEFWIAAARVAALVGDGHTSVDVPDLGHKRLWLDVEPLDNRLVVIGVYRKPDSRFLGTWVKSVEGTSLRILLEGVRTLRGSDGPYSDLLHVAQALRSEMMLGYLLQKREFGDSLAIELESEGDTVAASFSFASEQSGELVTPKTALELPPPGPNDMSWVFLPGREVAYLRIDSMRKYRENFEYQRGQGASEEFVRELLAMAGFASKGDLASCIQAVPSASQTILELTTAIKAHAVTNLVVDLRKNSGGNSYLAYMLAYFLRGEEVLTVDEGYIVKRHSQLSREQFPGVEARRSAGGYDFTDRQRWTSGKKGIGCAEWDVEMAQSPTFLNVVRNHEPLGETRIFVLTSALTFSAGFDLAFLLKKLGGVVVGVEPSQPDNAFLETLRFSLPNSGLKGWVSSKLMIKSPAQPIQHRFKPDVELSFDEYRKFGFDPNSSLLLALRSVSSPSSSS
jgi:hypothetical protein